MREIFDLQQESSSIRVGRKLTYLGLVSFIFSLLLIPLKFGITFGTTLLVISSIIVIFLGFLLTQEGNPKLKWVRIISFAVVVFVVLILSFTQVLIMLGASSDTEVEADYLIVLGAGVRGEEPSLTLQRRLDAALAYLNKNSNTLVIASGGLGQGNTMSESEVMQKYFISNGIHENRIILEDRSTTTSENIKYSKEIIHSLENKENKIGDILIVTSDYHLFRAKLLSKRNGLNAYGIASETPRFVYINYSLRESMALIKSFILDR